MDKVLCIIPARGGSKRIPHKNIRNFLGKPIIAYSIEAVKSSGIADEIMVSTDDEEIAKVAQLYGAKVPFMRDSETSNDYSGVADVLVEVVNKYLNMGKEFSYTLCVFATAPLISSENLKNAYKILQNSINGESISTVESYSYPPQRGLFINNDGLMEMVHPENYNCRSQDLQKIYHDSCQFTLFKTYALLRDKMMYTKHAIPFILNESESQDIDNLEDWKLAEMKYKLKNRNM